MLNGILVKGRKSQIVKCYDTSGVLQFTLKSGKDRATALAHLEAAKISANDMANWEFVDKGADNKRYVLKDLSNKRLGATSRSFSLAEADAMKEEVFANIAAVDIAM